MKRLVYDLVSFHVSFAKVSKTQPARRSRLGTLSVHLHPGTPHGQQSRIISPRCKGGSTPVLIWGTVELFPDISTYSLRRRGTSHYFLHPSYHIAYPPTDNYSLQVLHEKHWSFEIRPVLPCLSALIRSK